MAFVYILSFKIYIVAQFFLWTDQIYIARIFYIFVKQGKSLLKIKLIDM